MRVRLATEADVPMLAQIYNQGIEDRIATFETRLRTAEEMASWLKPGHSLVVVEQAEEVLGYASTSSYRPRECYAGVAEFSVYVRRDWRGQGVGRLALEALIEQAARAGLWKLLSRIFVENAASRALARSLGFREVGIYEKHAILDGIFRDVVIVERLIPDNMTQSGNP